MADKNYDAEHAAMVKKTYPHAAPPRQAPPDTTKVPQRRDAPKTDPKTGMWRRPKP